VTTLCLSVVEVSAQQRRACKWSRS